MAGQLLLSLLVLDGPYGPGGWALPNIVNMTRKIGFILAFAVICLLSAACASTDSIDSTAQPDTYQVGPGFREFYDLLGGVEVLGPAISPVFESQDTEYQYTERALMVRELKGTGKPSLRLAALGLDMGIAEPAVPDPEQPGVRYVNGHIIYEPFVALYEKLGGARYVGKPITELHYNPQKGRYEQYFENLGFYSLEQDPPAEAHLLAYGVWKCNSSCRQRNPGAGAIELPFRVGKPFQDAVKRLGPDFTGFAISEVYQTPDDYVEQVFENVILVVASDGSGRVFLRPITTSLGIRPDELVEHNGDREGFTFISTQGERGYYVYQKFLDYIAKHGGMDASGEPIGALFQFDARKSRQCFVNLCLEEHHSSNGSSLIRPAANGYSYLLLPLQPIDPNNNQFRQGTATNPTQSVRGDSSAQSLAKPTEVVLSTLAARELVMRVWESYPMLAPDQSQEIGVRITEDNVPVSSLEPYLVVTYPSGQEKTFYMDLTGEDGVSLYVLDPIQAPNGTLIPYQVCILDLDVGKYCLRDSFMIWQNP